MTERLYCSDLARDSQASLMGTAVPVDIWLLIEYPRPWKPKALQDNELSEDVGHHLAALPEQVAHDHGGRRLRVQFVKQAASDDQVRPRVFAAHVNDQGSTLFAGTLASYASIAELTAKQIVTGELPDRQPTPAELLLICTNGQRDLCCARYGLPLYEMLRMEYGSRVWQTTHIGGHRYAPNLVCLPSGLVYGFVAPEKGVDLVVAHDKGLIDTALLRGRSCYTEVEQAAEVFGRRALDDHASVFNLRSSTRRDGQADEYTVVFATAEGVDLHIELRREPQAESIVASCGAEPKSIYQFTELAVRRATV